MLYDSHQQRLIIERCWLIYDLITEMFPVPCRFHVEFPSLVELALTSGYFQIFVKISRKGHFLHIHEEYDSLLFPLSVGRGERFFARTYP